MLTNLCLNQLTSARARRETYVGQWLPEPLLAGDPMLGPADTAEQRESVSFAVLTLMERLSPNERAVYVLREAFDYPHREIAEILDITESASQQTYHRAKQHVADGKARTEVDAAAARRIVEEFLAAATSGRTEPLVRLLTADAIAIGDGGGKVPARAKAIEGALAVARFLRGLFKPAEAKRVMARRHARGLRLDRQRRPRRRGGRERPGRRRDVPGGHRRGHRRVPQPGQPRQARTARPSSGRPPTTGSRCSRPSDHAVRCFTARSCQETAGCPVQGANPQQTGVRTCSTASSSSEPATPEPSPPGASPSGCTARRSPITLVNAEPDFVERVRMHQLATGQDLKPRPLQRDVRGHRRRTEARDGHRGRRRPQDRHVVDGGAEELEYDTLVYALGSGWDAQGVPGIAEHAYELASRPGALRLRERLTHLDAGQTVIVVGGGLTGLEAATEIAEARPDLDVALAARGGLGDWLSPKGRRHLRKVVGKLGITVHEHAAVTGVEADRVTTADGTDDPGRRSPCGPPASQSTRSSPRPTLEVTDTGQIVVDATMRSVSHPDVYAIGDAAFAMGAENKPLRMSCASGMPMAWQAADSIAARLTGGKLPHAPLRYFNQCISLGRTEGLIQYVTADDRAVKRGPDRTVRRRLQGADLQGRRLERRQPDARDADPAPPRRRRSARMDYLIRAGMDRATMPLAA